MDLTFTNQISHIVIIKPSIITPTITPLYHEHHHRLSPCTGTTVGNEVIVSKWLYPAAGALGRHYPARTSWRCDMPTHTHSHTPETAIPPASHMSELSEYQVVPVRFLFYMEGHAYLRSGPGRDKLAHRG